MTPNGNRRLSSRYPLREVSKAFIDELVKPIPSRFSRAANRGRQHADARGSSGAPGAEALPS
jgi:hypothetical protein